MQRDRPPRASIKRGTFAEVIRSYLGSPKFADLADSTRTSYRYLLGIAERPEVLGAYSTDEIRPALVQAYLDGFSDRLAQQRCAKTAICAVEKWAIVRDMIPYPITTGTEAPGGDGGHLPWPDDLVALAERECKPHLSHLITLAANVGQRGSDLAKMRATDFEEYQGRPGINVTQKKTGLVIWVPFTQELQRAIATWERRPGFLLLKEDGQPWTRSQISDQWLRARETVPALAPLKDMGLVIHGLRGTACVRLLRAGAHTRQIADMVGMSELMVKRYTRFAEQRKNALAAVVHLDERRPNGIKSDRSDLVG